MDDEVCIATFPTSHAALRAEREAKAAGIAVRMIPVPRAISADCNMGMAADVDDMARLRALLSDRGIDCDLVKWRER